MNNPGVLIAAGPSEQTVLAHLSAGRAVPIYREFLADLETPVSAYLKLAGDKPAFLLESAEHDDSVGRYSLSDQIPTSSSRCTRARPN